MEHGGNGRPPGEGDLWLCREGDPLTDLLDPTSVAAVVARAIAFAAIVVVAGSVTFYWAVLQRWTRSGVEDIADWTASAARVGGWAAAVLLLVSPIRLYVQARSLIDAGDPAAPMMGSVLQTTWGKGWVLQVAAAAAALGGFLLARRGRRRGWWLAVAAALALTLSPGLMGHAVAAERYLPLSLLADWVHVTAAGAWIGALCLIALAAAASSGRATGGESTAHLIERFHPVALVGAGTILATGVVNVLLRVEHLRSLIGSTYGTILFVKVALSLLVIGLGAHHARHGAARVRERGAGAVVPSLVVETVIAAVVLATTAILVGTGPPMPMPM